MSRLSKIAPSGFVITLFWFSVAFAIGFIETPIRFSSGIPREYVLTLGHHLFHTLNRLEYALLIVTGVIVFLSVERSRLFVGWLVLLGCVVGQTLLLILVLDARTLRAIAGDPPPPAPYHTIYIMIELVKLGVLVTLTYFLVRSKGTAPTHE